LRYIELNMVRCGAVTHPADWDWSGYGELMGTRRRNRLLDQEKLWWLLRGQDPAESRRQLEARLGQAIIDGELKRQAKGTESIAVGDRACIEAIEEPVRGRQQLRVEEQSGTWTLREPYEAVSGAENSALGSFEPLIPL
jgi:putative transposase